MAFTYDAAPFAGTPPYTGQTLLDSIRFLIGDTLSTDPQLQDAEITGMASIAASDPYQTAILCCDALVAHYARQVDKTSGDLDVAASQRVAAYKALKASLLVGGLRQAPITPYAGGQSISDMEVDQDNDDLVQPQFSIGMMDDPGEAGNFDGPVGDIWRDDGGADD